MKRRSVSVNGLHSERPIGSAVEMVGGRTREQVCYGTYQGDMPDQRFRFRIAMVEHADSFRLHAHEYSELCIVLGGRALHRTEHEDYPLETGDVFVISGDTRHGFQNPQGLKLCNLMFDPQQFLAGHRDLERLAGFHALFNVSPRARRPHEFKERLHLTAAQLAEVTALISAIKSECEHQEEGWHAGVRHQFLLLALYLSRLYTRQTRGQATPLMRMAKVVSHIQQHYGDDLRIAGLARLAHLSVSQFQRTFKRIYGATPVRFINQVRVHEACEMLKDPNRSITEIAFAAGYASSSFFSTQFKSFMGQSPLDYRRAKLGGVNGNGH
ncbi:MAG: AraC family transcriptional regulator [Verrucomicrobiota bacterium]